METLLGIKGPDFVMLAADTTHANSVIVMKEGKIEIGMPKTGSVPGSLRLTNIFASSFFR